MLRDNSLYSIPLRVLSTRTWCKCPPSQSKLMTGSEWSCNFCRKALRDQFSEVNKVLVYEAPK